MRRSIYLALAAISAPAAAQEAATPEPSASATVAEADKIMETSVYDGNFLLMGFGGVAMPDYQGADESTISPAGGIYGEFAGVTINPRAAGIALDFIPDPKGQRYGLSLGPVVRYRANRTGKVEDPVVALLPKLDGLVEAGVAVGVTFKDLLNGFDRLTVGTDIRWDISGKDAGRVITPGVSYFTPLSKGVVMGARVGAEFVDDKYANYNFAIDAAGSAASGLRQYAAHGGFKEWNAGAFAGWDLSNNFLDGGLAVGVGGQYVRLQGSAAETPITAIRGQRSQWYFGAGMAYTF